MNREQRRAQLKQLGKKFNGIDVTRGTIEIPIGNNSENLTVDLMNYDTIYYLSEIADKFSNLEEYYKDDFDNIDSIENKSRKSMALIKLYKKIIDDFTVSVDKIFGDDATKKIFGNNAPMPQAIAEFIEDLSPVLTAISTMMNSETNSINNTSSNFNKYSGDRLGNV